MTRRTREAVDRVINGLWAGMSAETVLLDLLRVLRDEDSADRPDDGQEETP